MDDAFFEAMRADCEDPGPWPEWFAAAADGDTRLIRARLAEGFDVDTPDRWGATALYRAVAGRSVAVVRLLLDHGATVNVADRAWASPMAEAIVWGRIGPAPEDGRRVIGWFLEAGGRFGFREAVALGDVDLARRRLDEDPDIDVSDDARVIWHDTYLILAARWGDLEMARFLLDRGADIEGTDDLGQTPLIRAAQAGQVAILRLLLDRGAEIDQVGSHSSLAEAAIGGHAEAVALLLSRGAKRTLADAIALDDFDLAARLVEAEALRCIPGFRLRGLLAVAARRGNPATVALLLDHGATIDAACPDLALAEAARAGHLAVVRLLLDRGADVAAKDGYGETARDAAIRSGHPEIAALLDAAAGQPDPPAGP